MLKNEVLRFAIMLIRSLQLQAFSYENTRRWEGCWTPLSTIINQILCWLYIPLSFTRFAEIDLMNCLRWRNFPKFFTFHEHSKCCERTSRKWKLLFWFKFP